VAIQKEEGQGNRRTETRTKIATIRNPSIKVSVGFERNNRKK
ncbi:uncharacterized protein METZ01_LOCUS239156, partial [marine metagenome]